MIKSGREKFSRFCTGAILVLSILFMLCLLTGAFLSTTEMSTGGREGEIVTFFSDNVFVNTLVTVLMLSVLYLLLNVLENVSLNKIVFVLLVWTLIFGGAFVCSGKLQPSQDSYIVTFFAQQSAKGDYSYYHDYFRNFPFQLGFVLYEEIFFRLFFTFFPHCPEGFSALALQLMNVLFTAAAFFALVKISGLLFDSASAQKLTVLLLMLCIQPLFFCTYMYGNTPAFCFSCLGVWMFLLFQKNSRIFFGLLCSVFIALAVLLKLNSLIYFVAIGIVWLLCILKKPSRRCVLCLAFLVVLVFVLKPLPQKYYEARMGESLGNGIPQWSWMAMGLNEGQSCAGWYDAEYTTDAFLANDFDPAPTAEYAKSAIRARLDCFRSSPASAADFFGRKFLSQWNEPTYQSLWTNQSRRSYSEYGKMYNFFCVEHAAALAEFMNLMQQLVVLGYTFGLVMLLKKRDILTALPALTILGAMLYHLLFEAKSQYSIGYFILMLPIAAYGLCHLFTLAKRERN